MVEVRLLSTVIMIFFLRFTGICNHTDTSKPYPSTVLIFDHIPPYVRSIFPFPRFEHKDNRFQLTIFDDFYATTFNPKPSVSDTIIFHQKNEHIVLSFLYSLTREPFTYVVQKGDTITIRFVGDMPYATNQDTSRNDYLNYEYHRLLATNKLGQPTSYEIYRYPVLVAKDVNELINHRGEIQQSLARKSHL